MVTADLPTVSVWYFGTVQWRLAGDLPNYTYLDFDCRHNDAGAWQLTVPNDVKAGVILPGRMVTVDWRGRRVFTGLITGLEPIVDESGAPLINLTGLDVYSIFGWALAWRDPTKNLPNQPTFGSVPTPALTPAETAVLKVIRDNLVTRMGFALTVPASQGRGIFAGIRPNFQNVGDLVSDRSNRGGIGVSVDLLADAGLPDVRADLTVSVYVPVDRSIRVVFNQALGTLLTWSLKSSSPTGTSAVVSGDANTFLRAFTTQSTNDEATWGGRREVFVKTSGTSDSTEMTDAGQSALNDTDSTQTVTIVAAETGGLKAFRDYKAGDIARAELLPGLAVTDTISSIRVVVDPSGPAVTTTFGDPDKASPDLRMARIIRALRRDVNLLKRSI